MAVSGKGLNITTNKALIYSLPFLLSFYFVFRLYGINIPEVRFIEFTTMLGLHLLFSLFVFVPVKLILKDPVKSSLLTTILIFLNNSYGLVFYMSLNFNIAFMSRKVICLAALLVGIVASYLVFRSKNCQLFYKYVYIFVGVLLVFSFIEPIIRVIPAENDESDNISTKINSPLFQSDNSTIDSKNKPDIYFILTDNYWGDISLKNKKNYDNNEFLKELRQRGFYVPKNSRCNYPWTLPSLAATFNMRYLPDISMTVTELRSMIYKNRVMEIFSKMGYHINTLLLGEYIGKIKYADDDYRSTYTQFSEEVMLQTFAGLLLSRTILKTSGSDRTLKTFEILKDIVTRDNDKPTFTYAHLLTTHSPFFFTPEGELYEEIDYDWHSNEQDKYIDQIQFLNKKLLILIDTMLAKTPRPIIIIQSDHGKGMKKFPDDTDIETLEVHFNIFNTFYFPDEDHSLLNDTITSVNTFTVILKKYFAPDFELKGDKVFLLSIGNNKYAYKESGVKIERNKDKTFEP